eukprot:gnl/Chilomastix_cuspidata/3355.p1 GENE.gnl/Chilomastix_cuspidata/3355~~gnl/Chilomastix_cuspidata/3355.p1  ORF type:complete len:1101 (+),score=540.08 gnl/Chilomastix_cuspidata/3355:2003-5305(+)
MAHLIRTCGLPVRREIKGPRFSCPMSGGADFRPLEKAPRLRYFTDVDAPHRVDPARLQLKLVWERKQGNLYRGELQIPFSAKTAPPRVREVFVRPLDDRTTLREIDISLSLPRSKHFLPCIGVVKLEQTPALVFPYVEAGDLHAHVLGAPGLPLKARLRLAIGVGKAINRLHDEGLLHFALKPQNVLLSSAGRPMLADFARAYPLAGDAGEVPGVPSRVPPRYNALEVFEQRGGYSRRTESYAFGMLVAFIVGGAEPFAKTLSITVPGLVASGTLPELPKGSPVAPIVKKLLAPNPTRRASIGEALSALRDLHASFASGLPALSAEVLKVVRRFQQTDGSMKKLAADVAAHSEAADAFATALERQRNEQSAATGRLMAQVAAADKFQAERGAALDALIEANQGALEQLAALSEDIRGEEGLSAALDAQRTQLGAAEAALEAHARFNAETGGRVGRLEEEKEELGERVFTQDARVAELEASVAELKAAATESEKCIASLAAHVVALEENVDSWASRLAWRGDASEGPPKTSPTATDVDGVALDTLKRRAEQNDAIVQNALSACDHGEGLRGLVLRAVGPRVASGDVGDALAATDPSLAESLENLSEMCKGNAHRDRRLERDVRKLGETVSTLQLDVEQQQLAREALANGVGEFRVRFRQQLEELTQRFESGSFRQLESLSGRVGKVIPAVVKEQKRVQALAQGLSERIGVLELKFAQVSHSALFRASPLASPKSGRGTRGSRQGASAESPLHGQRAPSDVASVASAVAAVAAESAQDASLSSPRLLRSLSASVLPSIHSTTPYTSVHEFSAFPGAGSLPYVVALMSRKAKRRVYRIGGIDVAEPVALDIPCGPYMHVTTALSQNGLLFVFDGGEDCLHMHDLRGDFSAVVGPFPNLAFIATHGDAVVLGIVDSTRLLKASVQALLASPAVGTFGEYSVPRVSSSVAHTDLCPWTGRVVYAGPDGLPTELDVTTCEAHVHQCAGEVDWIASQSAIRAPGAACVYNDGFSLRHLTEEWEEAPPLGELSDAVLMVVPSSSKPASLARAAWLDWNRNVLFRGKRYPFTSPAKPAKYHALVRVFRDIFICLDEARQRWVALRISVP